MVTDVLVSFGKKIRLPSGDQAKRSLAPALPGTVMLEPFETLATSTTPPVRALEVPGAGLKTMATEIHLGKRRATLPRHPWVRPGSVPLGHWLYRSAPHPALTTPRWSGSPSVRHPNTPAHRKSPGSFAVPDSTAPASAPAPVQSAPGWGLPALLHRCQRGLAPLARLDARTG